MKLWMRGCLMVSALLISFLLAGAAAQENQAPPKDGAAPAEAKGDAAKGKAVFEEKCSLCHSADTDEMLVGPGLKNLFHWPPHKMSDGTEHQEHTVEIIRKQMVEGGGAMPPMGESLSSEDVENLLAYLQTL